MVREVVGVELGVLTYYTLSYMTNMEIREGSSGPAIVQWWEGMGVGIY